MAAEKSPSFQFYPRDFLADPHVMGMTLAERGAYITLLCLCWTERTLPADSKALARLLKVPHPVFQRMWHMNSLARCFKKRGNLLTQPRLDIERAKQREYRELQAIRGRAGGVAKAGAGLASAKPRARARPNP